MLFLHEERARGRSLYLVTGADNHLAWQVAAHLGIFTGVFGSDGALNLTGMQKLDYLRGRLDDGAFDYIGNDAPDVPLLVHATEAMVANPSLWLRLKLRKLGLQPARAFAEQDRPLWSVLRALRVHQWAKNLLIFLPLLLAHVITVDRLLDALLAFCCFSLTASSAYIVNDLLDIEADRRHPQKRLRPFASGDLSALTGFVIVAIFLLLAFLGARLLPIAFTGWLLLYLATTLAYTPGISSASRWWMCWCSPASTRCACSPALPQPNRTSRTGWPAFQSFCSSRSPSSSASPSCKTLRISGLPPRNGRGYLVADIDQLRSFGTASAFAAVMVFAIYISGSDVTLLYRRPELLWLIMPLMILWLCRVWLLASRGELNEDPLVFALTDRLSVAHWRRRRSHRVAGDLARYRSESWDRS